MPIENFYFPIFLLVMAVFVVWLFNRFKDSDTRTSYKKRRRSTSGRYLNENSKLQRSVSRSGPAAGHRPQHGLKTQDAMWRSRNQRARHQQRPDNRGDVGSGVFQASYLNYTNRQNQKSGSAGIIGEQGVSDTEYTGLDEYLTKKKAQEKFQEAGQEGSLSMTAVKFEPVSKSSDDEAPGEKKQAG